MNTKLYVHPDLSFDQRSFIHFCQTHHTALGSSLEKPQTRSFDGSEAFIAFAVGLATNAVYDLLKGYFTAQKQSTEHIEIIPLPDNPNEYLVIRKRLD